jgi:polysaccharide export outer membrane protein
MRFSSTIGVFITVIIASCSVQKKTSYNYFQNAKDTTGKQMVNFPSPVVRKGDVLSIKVFSKANGLNQLADAPYNLPQVSGTSGGSTNDVGFLVDRFGDIIYPQLGSLHLEGLTREQVAEFMKSRLDTLLKEPVGVLVRFLNFRVSILGEVRSPGTFTFPTERVTILEAIGISGDISDYGIKNRVMVIRENEGHVERGMIDLTSDSLFTSPYYRLQQNDVVIVESNGRRLRQLDRSETAQQIGLATSIVTGIALILNFIK